MKGIEKIIYNTTRGIYSVEDKLSIATIFIFCYRLKASLFAELLYCDSPENVIEKLQKEYSGYDVSFKIRFEDKNVKDCFSKTLIEVREKEDKQGFYKALFEKDPYALAIEEIVKYDFDYKQFKNITNEMGKQLSIFES